MSSVPDSFYNLFISPCHEQVEIRMPDVVIATLTRRSAMKAMQKGMSAELIANFLRARVHPIVAAQVRSSEV